jgi:hypothetical protein
MYRRETEAFVRHPLIRASYFKTLIGDVKRLPERDRNAVLEAVGAPMRAQIREAALLDWMPADPFARLTGIVAEKLGERGALVFWKRSMLVSLSRAFLMPLKIGAISLYGKAPGSLIKMAPRAWSLLMKDCGGCTTLDASPASVLLRFSDLPFALRVRSMMHVWAGGCDACLEETGFEGSVLLHDDKLALGRADIEARWGDPRPPPRDRPSDRGRAP